MVAMDKFSSSVWCPPLASPHVLRSHTILKWMFFLKWVLVGGGNGHWHLACV